MPADHPYFATDISPDLLPAPDRIIAVELIDGEHIAVRCHGNARGMAIQDTAHANADDPDTPAAQKACESCHGPSKIHMQFPMQVGNIVFTKHGSTPISRTWSRRRRAGRTGSTWTTAA